MDVHENGPVGFWFAGVDRVSLRTTHICLKAPLRRRRTADRTTLCSRRFTLRRSQSLASPNGRPRFLLHLGDAQPHSSRVSVGPPRSRPQRFSLPPPVYLGCGMRPTTSAAASAMRFRPALVVHIWVLAGPFVLEASPLMVRRRMGGLFWRPAAQPRSAQPIIVLGG